MAIITIGVPVYNAETYLDDCLACLRDQTFQDFEVLIYDNASTDRTGSIAQAFANGDGRFKYIRQPHNKGAAQNFIDVLHAAKSEFFIWRAHDDLCSDNYLEVMHQLFRDRPQTRLAVSVIEKVKNKGAKRRRIPVCDLNGGAEPLRIRRALMTSEASWFYGLWHRETLIREFGDVWKFYPYGWGSDHLTLLRPLLRNEVSGSNEATFLQFIQSRTLPIEKGGPPVTAIEMQVLKRRFIETCSTLAASIPLTLPQRLTLAGLMPLYAGKRVRSSAAIAAARFKEITGV